MAPDPTTPTPAEQRQCRQCGKAFVPRQPRNNRPSVYCSPVCRRAWDAARYVPRPRIKVTCQVCRKEFFGRVNKSRYCAYPCWLAAKRVRERAEPKRTPPGNGSCLVCGKEIKPLSGSAFVKRYCSTPCVRRAAQRRERANLNAARHQRASKVSLAIDHIDPFAVFNRDGWRCGVCGLVVRQDLRWPHPYSASVDHIVPLSKGGEHTMINVQCAHLRCNVRKNNRAE